jgi:hypothetical protein
MRDATGQQCCPSPARVAGVVERVSGNLGNGSAALTKHSHFRDEVHGEEVAREVLQWLDEASPSIAHKVHPAELQAGGQKGIHRKD